MDFEALLKPWREVAERRGFRLLERKVELIERGRRCIDYLASGATFLDLYAEDIGFWSATLTTWIDAGEARFSLTTIGEAMPRPRPRGAAGWIAARLVAPLMHKLAPPDARPVPMSAPADLEKAIDKHLAELLAIAGKLVPLPSLQARREQEQRDSRS